MWKLIVGILLILGTINNIVTSGLQKFDTSTTEGYYSQQGYIGGQIIIIVLAIWLIYSWAKNRKKRTQ